MSAPSKVHTEAPADTARWMADTCSGGYGGKQGGRRGGGGGSLITCPRPLFMYVGVE